MSSLLHGLGAALLVLAFSGGTEGPAIAAIPRVPTPQLCDCHEPIDVAVWYEEQPGNSGRYGLNFGNAGCEEVTITGSHWVGTGKLDVAITVTVRPGQIVTRSVAVRGSAIFVGAATDCWGQTQFLESHSQPQH